MRIALDTNILVYAEGVNDVARRDVAADITRQLPRANACIPMQVLCELFHVLTRKARWPVEAAHAAVLGWRDTFSPIEATHNTLLSALDLASGHQLRIWDAIVVATAAEAGCRLLLSEDMQAGFTWHGVTVVNPLATPRHALLEAALADGRN